MHKYGGLTMADIASSVISDGLVKQHLLSPLEKSINCSYIHKMFCGGQKGLKWYKNGEIFNRLSTQQQNITR